MQEQNAFRELAVVELFGHQKLAGYVARRVMKNIQPEPVNIFYLRHQSPPHQLPEPDGEDDCDNGPY